MLSWSYDQRSGTRNTLEENDYQTIAMNMVKQELFLAHSMNYIVESGSYKYARFKPAQQ